MSNDIEYENKPKNGKILAGLILLAVGGVLLLSQLSFFSFPFWLFSWPMWLIVWGLFIGSRHNFRKPSWLILVVIGCAFLLNNLVPDLNIGSLIWPVVLIGIGIWMIVKRNHRWDRKQWKKDWTGKWDPQSNWRNYMTPTDPAGNLGYTESDTSATFPPKDSSGFGAIGDDYLDATAIFGGVNKTILSKDFKGGEIVNIFGGAELDFTQADINGRVVIDVTQIFGGIKIIVPPHWQVVSDLAAVFAGVDDKRIKSTASAGSDKILVLKGTSIFAGVDIRSF